MDNMWDKIWASQQQQTKLLDNSDPLLLSPSPSPSPSPGSIKGSLLITKDNMIIVLFADCIKHLIAFQNHVPFFLKSESIL